MGYDLKPKRTSVPAKNITAFTWPAILRETGACYLLGCGDHTFDAGKYLYDGSRTDGSPVANDGFEVPKEEALAMARIFEGYVQVKRALRQEWEKLPENEQVRLKSLFGAKAEPPVEAFLQKVEGLAEFCGQSEGFNIW